MFYSVSSSVVLFEPKTKQIFPSTFQCQLLPHVEKFSIFNFCLFVFQSVQPIITSEMLFLITGRINKQNAPDFSLRSVADVHSCILL